MEVKLFIERKFENEFRRSIEMMNSMAIGKVMERNEYLVFVVEETNEDSETFLVELFFLGIWFERFKSEVK